VTVAPVASSAAGGISMPPPSAVARSKSVEQVGPQCPLELVSPPVSLTRRIATFGSVAAPRTPIVSTGPPPRIVVAPARAPTRVSDLSIVIPPGKLPRPRWMTSPSWAASTAAWIVAKQSAPRPTQSESARAAAAVAATIAAELAIANAVKTTRLMVSSFWVPVGASGDWRRSVGPR
jgi:hypothetical protein